MKRANLVVAFCLFLLALVFLIGPRASITGAFIGTLSKSTFSVFGLIIALAAGIIFASEMEKRIHLMSAIKKDKGLMKLVDESANSEKVQRELDHLTRELGKGNMPGRVRHIENTDIFYLGGRNGARVYYRQKGNVYEIVGKSAKGKNQDKVIDKLVAMYGSKK